MTKKFLAIGGPKSFKWIPATRGYDYRVPVIGKPKLFTGPIDNVLDAPMDIHTYRRHRISNFENETYKDVYVSEELSIAQAEAELKHWLLSQFIAMDDPDDSD